MADEINDAGAGTTAVMLAAELASAWLANPNTKASADEVAGTLKHLYDAIQGLGQDAAPEAAAPAFVPAVSVRKSLASPDHIISMIDGKPYRVLRRHLRGHGLTPEQYRERYGLKADYPMVAPSYTVQRGELARAIGLGARRRKAPAPDAAADTPDADAPEVAEAAVPEAADDRLADAPALEAAVPADGTAPPPVRRGRKAAKAAAAPEAAPASASDAAPAPKRRGRPRRTPEA